MLLLVEEKADARLSDLSPEWDQIIYVPVHSLRETLMLECMDYQHLTRDRSLGSAELRISELAREADDPRYPYVSTGKKECADDLRLDKGGGFKGKVHYVAEFIPALALNGVKFAGGPNEVQRAAEAGQGEDDGDDARDTDESSMSSSDEEIQRVPQGITVRAPMGAANVNGRTSESPVRRSSDSTSSAETAKTRNTSRTTDETAQEKGVNLTREELLKEREYFYLGVAPRRYLMSFQSRVSSFAT